MKWRLPSVTSSTLEIEVADAFRKEAKCGKSKRQQSSKRNPQQYRTYAQKKSIGKSLSKCENKSTGHLLLNK